jgi:hypothetical protein
MPYLFKTHYTEPCCYMLTCSQIYPSSTLNNGGRSLLRNVGNHQISQKTAVVMLTIVRTSNLTFILRCPHHNVGSNYFSLSFSVAFRNRNAVAIRNRNLKEALFFYPEDKGNKFFRNDGNHLLSYMMPHHPRVMTTTIKSTGITFSDTPSFVRLTCVSEQSL